MSTTYRHLPPATWSPNVASTSSDADVSRANTRLPHAMERRRFSACRTELAYMRFFRWGPKPSKDQDERWPFMITA